MNRRGLLGAILAAGMAPAAIGSGILMPVRRVWVPSFPTPEMIERSKFLPPINIAGTDGDGNVVFYDLAGALVATIPIGARHWLEVAIQHLPPFGDAVVDGNFEYIEVTAPYAER